MNRAVSFFGRHESRSLYFNSDQRNSRPRNSWVAPKRVLEEARPGHLLEQTFMPRYIYGESVAAFTESRAIPWRALLDGGLDTLRTWLKRHRERTELLHYMTIDHRAASDIGTSRESARDWAERPFWRG
jgi:uncharacterized protein YjiS (DUF1127 family)